MRALVTGSDGFVGRWLVERLKSDGHDVVGFDVESDFTSDILMFSDVCAVVEWFKPTHVFHLAAQTCVPDSWDNPKHSLEINTLGTLNLLQALVNYEFRGRLLIAGTSEEYGYAHHVTHHVLDETSPTLPNTPYGIGKLAASNLGQVYAQHYGLNVICTRASNHVGPGQHGGVIAEWARQIVEIERGKRDVLKHGDIRVVRSFLDVRDVVEAYVTALSGDLEPGVYNISPRGLSVTLGTVLTWLKAHADVPIETEEDESLARPTEVKRFVPMTSDWFRLKTGWEPQHELRSTLEDVLNWWRKEL